jgi:hypothetical protein
MIECGEIQAKTGLSNCPKQSDNFSALHELVCHVLDPVIYCFGMINQT